MTTTGTSFEQYGFWALIAVMLIRDLFIPLSNKIIPWKIKASITWEERAVVALENSNKVAASMVELMRQSTNDHAAILKTLVTHGETLAVLMDRDKKTKPRKQ